MDYNPLFLVTLTQGSPHKTGILTQVSTLPSGSLVNIGSVPGSSDFLTPDRPCVRQGMVGIAIRKETRSRGGCPLLQCGALIPWTTHQAPDRDRGERKVPKQQALAEVSAPFPLLIVPFTDAGAVLGLGIPCSSADCSSRGVR